MAVPGISANRSRGQRIHLPQPALPVIPVALVGAKTMGAAAVSRSGQPIVGRRLLRKRQPLTAMADWLPAPAACP